MFKMTNKQKAELRKIYRERADSLVKELAQINKEIDRLGTTKKKSKTERRNKRLTQKYTWKLKGLDFEEDLKMLKSLGINLYFDETKDTGTWDLKKLVIPAPNKCTEQQILSEAVKYVLMLNYSHEVYLNWLRETNQEKLQTTPREEVALSYIAARVTDGAKFFNMEQVAELMHLMLFTRPEILQTEQYKRWEEIMCQQKRMKQMENNKSLFQLAEEAEDCGNIFAKVRSISDVLVEALSVEGSAFTKDTLLNVAYILREYIDIAERKINALEKDLRGAFDRFECLS